MSRLKGADDDDDNDDDDDDDGELLELLLSLAQLAEDVGPAPLEADDDKDDEAAASLSS